MKSIKALLLLCLIVLSTSSRGKLALLTKNKGFFDITKNIVMSIFASIFLPIIGLDVTGKALKDIEWRISQETGYKLVPLYVAKLIILPTFVLSAILSALSLGLLGILTVIGNIIEAVVYGISMEKINRIKDAIKKGVAGTIDDIKRIR